MKKAAVIVGALVGAAVVFLLTLVVFVNVRGGLGPPHTGLAKMPLVGGLLKVGLTAEGEQPGQQGTEAALLPAGRQVPFLRFGPEARLARLAEELDLKKSDYDAMLRRLERRSRELDAWQQQLQQEMADLRARFGKEKEDLAQLRGELQRKESELQAMQTAIEQAEERNLKTTAEIYGKMSPQKAAEVLGHMYAGGEQDTVVKIIYLMGPRPAAKTLEAFEDPKIGAQITEQLKHITKSEQQGG